MAIFSQLHVLDWFPFLLLRIRSELAAPGQVYVCAFDMPSTYTNPHLSRPSGAV